MKIVIGTFLSPFFIARLEDNTHQTHLGTDNGGVLKETRNIPRQQQQAVDTYILRTSS